MPAMVFPRVPFEPISVPLLTASSISAILGAARRGAPSARVSLDLHLSYEEVPIRGGEAHIRGVAVRLGDLEEALARASSQDVVAAWPDGSLGKVQFFSSGSFYKLRNVEGSAPTLEINGIHMHRISGSTPWDDALAKVRAARVGPGSVVLDTATGLGYTAVHSLGAGASRVLTVEVDPNVLRMASLNPWSRGLASGRVEVVPGDAVEVVGSLPGGTFTHVLHDPPRFALSPRMYSGELYSQILRVLRPGGVLLHYTGEPGRARGRNLPGSTASRLRSAGFEVLGYDPRVMAVIARRPRRS
ncbi:MAG: class I SAM-dependent methyltransferase [Conexivisphaera sp.]